MSSEANNTINSFYLDRPEWGDEVVRNKDQTVAHPMEINEPLAWILGAFCVFGFPLNFEIIIHILYDKTMRLKPRYIIQLAIAFSGVFLLLTNVVLIVDFCFGPNEILCNVFVSFLMGVPYNCFMLNYFLYLIECFVAIAFPLWHRVYVTHRPVVYGLIGLNSSMALAVELPLIIGIAPVRCDLQWVHGPIINGIWAVFFVLCFVFCVVNFLITWFHLRRSPLTLSAVASVAAVSTLRLPIIIISPPSPDIAVAAADHFHQQSADKEEDDSVIEIIINLSDQYDDEATIGKLAPAIDDILTNNLSSLEMEILCMGLIHHRRRLSYCIPEEPDDGEEISSSAALDEEKTTSIDMTESGDSGSSSSNGSEGGAMAIPDYDSCSPLSRIEWKAIKMFLIGVVPLFLIPLPLFLFYYFHAMIHQHQLKSSSNNQQQYADFNWLIPYLVFLLISLHSLVNPITSLWLNKDFKGGS